MAETEKDLQVPAGLDAAVRHGITSYRQLVTGEIDSNNRRARPSPRVVREPGRVANELDQLGELWEKLVDSSSKFTTIRYNVTADPDEPPFNTLDCILDNTGRRRLPTSPEVAARRIRVFYRELQEPFSPVQQEELLRSESLRGAPPEEALVRYKKMKGRFEPESRLGVNLDTSWFDPEQERRRGGYGSGVIFFNHLEGVITKGLSYEDGVAHFTADPLSPIPPEANFEFSSDVKQFLNLLGELNLRRTQGE